jgi:thioredoxin reductase
MEPKPLTQNLYDYLVLGAGPAGLQLGYFLGQAGRSYLILERGAGAGEFFRRFPRHRMLISINKVFTGYDDHETNLRWDWNSLLSDDPALLFKNYSKEYFPSADTLVDYLGDFAERFGLAVQYDTDVVKVKKGRHFELTDQHGNVYTAKRLIVATGLHKPYQPPIAGFEEAELYTEVNVDPQDFVDQRVLVIGKGNSGFETAQNLIETAALIHVASPEPLQLAWKTHYVGHLRAVNNNFLDTYQLKSQNALLDATIHRIEKRDGKYAVFVSYTHAGGEQEELHYDRVIACTGFKFDASIFDESCRPALTIRDKFPAQTSEWESINVRDLYFAGTLMQMRDFRKTTSGFIHGFRYNVRSLVHMLELKYHASSWPSRPVEPTPEGVLEALLARINSSSALWQQFGFLGDLIVMPQDGGPARYYEELPTDYIHNSPFGREGSYYVLTLEFGKVTGDPFNIPRLPIPEHAERSTFLHPVIRHFAGGEQLSELHLLENLFGEWHDEALHREPLLTFLHNELAATPVAAAV